MRCRLGVWNAAFLLLGSGLMCGQQGTAPVTPNSQPVFKSESRLVLVDSVVTDKKGNYLRDLTAKDFRVWQDDSEQEIKTFSFQADPASPTRNRKQFIVLFFDNAAMSLSDQMQARQAAARIIDANAGPNRLLAIINFNGVLQISQNFTKDIDLLKKAITGVKLPMGPALDGESIGGIEGDFALRDSIMALRTVGKGLGSVPGRKTLVYFTAGFPLGPEYLSEVTATIDACNKSNVAIYPIDVRGLVAPMGAGLIDSPYSYSIVKAFFIPQKGGGGGGGGRGGGSAPAPVGGSGGGRGGSVGGGTGRSGGQPGGLSGAAANPFNQSRSLLPKFSTMPSTNQQIMHLLADGTGGFVIANTNDLGSGLEKIMKEQDEYYVLGYTPPVEDGDSTCHTIKVKVSRGGSVVRSRTGYCNVKSVDFLSGKPIEKELETRAASQGGGSGAASMQAPFFYTSPNVARVDVSMEIPSELVTFTKEKGKFRSTVNVLGIAYKQDGSVGARFSDEVKLDLENKKEVEQWKEKPLHYETQFEVASGSYQLKVVFSAGGASFGKAEAPLVVDPYDGKHFGISGIALSKEAHSISELDLNRDAALIEDHKPLVSGSMEITPSGSTHFKKTDPTIMYAEVYEPLLLTDKIPTVAVAMRILDRKTGVQKHDSGLLRLDKTVRPGIEVIPIGLSFSTAALTPGSYKIELRALDSDGKSSVRSVDFDVE